MMRRSGDTSALDRRGAISMLGSVMAVGVLGSCGGDEASSPSSSTTSSSPGSTSSPASTNAQCVVTPALTEGPYFVDERLNRSDIRTDPSTGAARPGVPLDLITADGIFRSGGTTLLVPLAASGGGYAGRM
jgi:hypothetical protein